MITLSNAISFLRAPLAFLFLTENILIRVFAIIMAMLSDSIDGYLARKRHSTSKFGAILDPVMDKFFVYFVLTIFFLEGKIQLWQALTMLSRDFFLCIFGIYLLIVNKWKGFKPQSIRWGKLITALQFIVLIALCINYIVPSFVYVGFIIFGALAFVELFHLSFNNSTSKG